MPDGPHPLRRRGVWAALAAPWALAACGPEVFSRPAAEKPADAPPPPTEAQAGPGSRVLEPLPTVAPGALAVVLPNSDLAAGSSRRFMFGLLGPDQRPVANAAVRLAFFKLAGQTAQLRAAGAAQWYSSPELGERGIYVTRVDLPEAGAWGVEVQAALPEGAVPTARASFEVKLQSATPAIGSPAPPSNTPVAATPTEVEKICSARPVDNLHHISVADALAQQRPFAVLLSTPAFCSSKMCGPALNVMQDLADTYASGGNFIHVELFEGGQPPTYVPAVKEWGLPSEPWLFLVDTNGTIAHKFDAVITRAEVEPFVAQLMGA